MSTTILRIFFAGVISLTVASRASAAEIGYTIADLGGNFFGVALNDSGQAAGTYYAGVHGQAAVAGRNGVGVHRLGFLPGDTVSQATAINNKGQVTGYSVFDPFDEGQDFGPEHAFFGDASGARLRSLAVGGVGRGINNAGQVTGSGSSAFLTGPNGGPVMDLGTLGRDFHPSEGLAINALGQVAGNAVGVVNHSFSLHAFVTGPNGEGFTDLGGLFPESFGLAINDSGQVAGIFRPAGTFDQHPFLSDPNGETLLDLGTLGGQFAGALGLNNSGAVVGYSDIVLGELRDAFIYTSASGIQDLNSLIDPSLGIHLFTAYDINNEGQIIVTGSFNNQAHSYLLTPTNSSGVPDSGSTGLLLGCALAGLLCTRRSVRRLPHRLHSRLFVAKC